MGGMAGTEEEAQVGSPDGRSSVRLRPFAWSGGAFHLPLHPSFSPTFMQQVPRGDPSPPTCMCAHVHTDTLTHTHTHAEGLGCSPLRPVFFRPQHPATPLPQRPSYRLCKAVYVAVFRLPRVYLPEGRHSCLP